MDVLIFTRMADDRHLGIGEAALAGEGRMAIDPVMPEAYRRDGTNVD
jgi:hypothetical protein